MPIKPRSPVAARSCNSLRKSECSLNNIHDKLTWYLTPMISSSPNVDIWTDLLLNASKSVDDNHILIKKPSCGNSKIKLWSNTKPVKSFVKSSHLFNLFFKQYVQILNWFCPLPLQLLLLLLSCIYFCFFKTSTNKCNHLLNGINPWNTV